MPLGLEGAVSGNDVEATTSNRLLVALPTAAQFPTDPGHIHKSWLRGTTILTNRVSQHGEAYISSSQVLTSFSFNGPAAGVIVNNKFNQNATTMATAVNAGFCRFNSGAVTTVSIGAALVSWQTFSLERGHALSLKANIRHTGGAVANKVFEFGLGYYLVAANQGNVPNEFVGFRWTAAGALFGVLEYSTGSNAVSQTTNINGGVPLSDSVAREYEVVVLQDRVEFWINGAWQAEIVFQPDSGGILKASGYPIMLRQYHTGSVPPLAPIFDVGHGSVTRFGPAAEVPAALKYSASGNHLSNAQHGLQAASGVTATTVATGVAPGAVIITNATTAISGLGGAYRVSGVAITATAHTNYLVSSFLNPALPTAIGALNDARPLVITELTIAPMVVSAVLTGGGATIEWFVAIGATSSTLAATDGTGGATPGTKAPRIIHLGTTDSIAAAQAAGTVVTRVGNTMFNFATPLVVQPGEYFMVGFRSSSVNAAVLSGTLDGFIGVNGFWM